MSTVYTFYGLTDDGRVTAGPNTYSTVRDAASGSSYSASDTSELLGQNYNGINYTIAQGFFAFDTSGLPSGGAAVPVTLGIYITTVATSGKQFIAGQPGDLGTLGNPDWRDLSELAEMEQGDAVAVVSGDANSVVEFPVSTTLERVVRHWVCLWPKDMVDNVAPTGNEYITAYMAERSGTSQDPRLIIELTDPPSATASITLGDITSTASATGFIPATLSATLGEIGLSATASAAIPATLYATLGEITLTSTGVGSFEPTASLSRQLLFTTNRQADRTIVLSRSA